VRNNRQAALKLNRERVQAYRDKRRLTHTKVELWVRAADRQAVVAFARELDKQGEQQ